MGDPAPGMPSGRHRAILSRVALVTLILEVALGLRIVAADAVQVYVDRRSAGATDPEDRPICIFPDAPYYWQLAGTIRDGSPYEVMYFGDIPHFALRTPGYPLFLAGCRSVFGDRTLPVRLVQAILGAFGVWLVYGLTRQVFPGPSTADAAGRIGGAWSVPLVAAAIAGVEPYTVLLSPLILSEALFVPLMLLSLWGMAALWNPPRADGRRLRDAAIASGAGVAAAAAVLVRPSWLLFVPLMLMVWIASSVTQAPTIRRRFAPDLSRQLRLACLVGLGFSAMMSPWWFRNYGVYGRFVPTALWGGASLYDGLNPSATGGSDMTFLADPDIWPLGEEDQDEELTRRALAFARRKPPRVGWLAIDKLARFWKPWPDADGFGSILLKVAGAAVTLPLFALMGVGLWHRRRDLRACTLLAGPVLYFCVLHLAFASSMRYRIPGELPALGLAAIGWVRLAERRPRSMD